MSTELKRVLDKAVHQKHDQIDKLRKTGTPLVEVLAYEAGYDRAVTILRTAYRKSEEDVKVPYEDRS
jgi:fumarate hydratase class II